MRKAFILVLAVLLAGCSNMPEAKGRRVCNPDGSMCSFQYYDGSGSP
jgi:hypothetical protein